MFIKVIGPLISRKKVVPDLQTSRNKVVVKPISGCVRTACSQYCCDKSGTNCYHLVTRLMTVTDLLHVVPTRLIQAVRNKLLRACSRQLVTCSLVGTTCCESVGLINLVIEADNNLFQTCAKLMFSFYLRS